MKGVVVAQKIPRQWLPYCTVLLQPQQIQGFSEDLAWSDFFDRCNIIDNELGSQEGLPIVPDFLEGLSWSDISSEFTTTTDNPEQSGDPPILALPIGDDVSVAKPGYASNRRQAEQITWDNIGWTTEPIQDLSQTLQLELFSANTEAAMPPLQTFEPAVSHPSYVKSGISQPPLDGCDAEASLMTQWLTLAEQLPLIETSHPHAAPPNPLSDPPKDGAHVEQPPCDNFDWVNDFDWVKELPDIDEAALQPKISTVDETGPQSPHVEPPVIELSGSVESSSFAQWVTFVGQLPLIEASQLQTPLAMPPSQDSFLSRQPSCTQTGPSLPAGQIVSSPSHEELPPANASTLVIVDLTHVSQAQLAHVYTSPTTVPQVPQKSVVSQAQPHLQNGPLCEGGAAARKAESSPSGSFTGSQGVLTSQHSSTASEQHQIDISQDCAKSSSSQDCPTSQLPGSPFDIQRHSLKSTQAIPNATKDHITSSQYSSLVESIKQAYPAKPKKRSVEATGREPQKAKKKRHNPKYFEFREKLLDFIKITLLDREIGSDVINRLSERDSTPLALMLRCIESFVKVKVNDIVAPDFFEALPGQIPWIYHWLCYAFSPNNQSCILDNELREDYVLPAAKSDDVSEQVWALITDTTKPKEARAFYNAVYQLYEAWKVERRRPPPVEETLLDEVTEERLRVCERSSIGPEANTVFDRLHGRRWFTTLATQVFHLKPIIEEATTPEDEFYQLMMGVAAVVALEPISQHACKERVQKGVYKQMALQLIGVRYSGPNGESALSASLSDPSAIRQCVKRGYLKPELLMSVTSELAQPRDGASNLVRRRFISTVLRCSANLFLRWSHLYEPPSAQTLHVPQDIKPTNEYES
eukprot:Blabericola_migrator_1__7713@NODE_393_length_9011_cov_44_629360_g313_i0_p1_GENE_NODE_393_length_9011_cov_44_629360_g313_i0NODE_393_length_9011_cov_44_629360_g313_i0_p1_ORF_typecomplete_len867_score136_60_NODE_393_length_9011_cov_44_629360_g313_i062838883